LADRARDDLGDSAARKTGRSVRPPGRPSTNATAAIQPLDGAIQMLAAEATLHGTGLTHDAPQGGIRGWTRAGDDASWEIAGGPGGTFLVEVLQSCASSRGGAELEIAVGEQALGMTVQETGGINEFMSRHVGRITLSKGGRRTLSLKLRQPRGGGDWSIRSLTLWPAEK
jgi:hypothetical protein